MGGVKLYDLNMQEIVLRGVKWFEFTPDPPGADRVSEKVHHGEITLGKTRKPRNIEAKMWYRSYDPQGKKLLRDEIYALLNPLKEFYVVDEDVPGKRWKVEVESFNTTQVNRTTAEVVVVFYCPKGLAESIGTTLDPFTFDANLWAYGMGLQEDAKLQDYVHDTATFSIFNAGTERIEPEESELLITLKSSTATATKVKITNTTTNEVWEYIGPLNAGDTITIDRIQSKRNAANIVGLTNLNLISLAPGNNNFKIEGITGAFEISFKFRYLYA